MIPWQSLATKRGPVLGRALAVVSDLESGPPDSSPAPEGGRKLSWEIDDGATMMELVAKVVFGPRIREDKDTADVVPRSLAAFAAGATLGSTVSKPGM